MALEAYIPQEVTFAGQPVAAVFAVTLYNPDSDDPHGSLTTLNPPAEGTRGPLQLRGTRDGQAWQVELPEIEISRSTAVGCEFTIFGRAQRRKVGA
jgi:hypothetical protein